MNIRDARKVVQASIDETLTAVLIVLRKMPTKTVRDCHRIGAVMSEVESSLVIATNTKTVSAWRKFEADTLDRLDDLEDVALERRQRRRKC